MEQLRLDNEILLMEVNKHIEKINELKLENTITQQSYLRAFNELFELRKEKEQLERINVSNQHLIESLFDLCN
jgi:hypothetical protein